MKYYTLVTQFDPVNADVTAKGTYATCLKAMKQESNSCYIERYNSEADFVNGKYGEIIKTKGWY